MSPATWSQFIEDASKQFTTAGKSPNGIAEFMYTLNSNYPTLPDEPDTEDCTRLSFILQECII